MSTDPDFDTMVEAMLSGVDDLLAKNQYPLADAPMRLLAEQVVPFDADTASYAAHALAARYLSLPNCQVNHDDMWGRVGKYMEEVPDVVTAMQERHPVAYPGIRQDTDTAWNDVAAAAIGLGLNPLEHPDRVTRASVAAGWRLLSELLYLPQPIHAPLVGVDTTHVVASLVARACGDPAPYRGPLSLDEAVVDTRAQEVLGSITSTPHVLSGTPGDGMTTAHVLVNVISDFTPPGPGRSVVRVFPAAFADTYPRLRSMAGLPSEV